MSEPGEAMAARPGKSSAAYRTIGEVAEDLDLPAHVLRFWESKFPQLKPLKRGGGRRYYRPEDITLLRQIRRCLYQDGYTIRGVQKLLSGGGAGAPASAEPSLFPLENPALRAQKPPPPRRQRRPAPAPQAEPPPDGRATLAAIRRDLLEARVLLENLSRRKRS